jgi:microcystin-dependent protein
MNAGMAGTAGGSQPFSTLEPYLSTNFCIALVGIFPPRS